MTESGSSRDPVEAIAAALSRVRSRRGPRPPWEGEGAGRARGGGPWERGEHGPRDHGMHGDHGIHGDHHPHEHDIHGSHGYGADGRGRPPGIPPWMAAAHGRFGGPARLRLLEALSSASVALSVSDLADRIGVDQPRASRLVQQAVAMGLVRREADPDDARRTRVVLTDTGSTIVRGFRGDRREAIETALAAFTTAERAELARLLTKFAASWPRP